MIEWLGWDDVILFRNDLANYDNMYWCANTKQEFLQDSPLEQQNLNSHERRILFFNWAGVYTLYRGIDLAKTHALINEPMIAKHLNMRIPTTIYHSVITNEEKTKIEGSDPDYRIKDVFNRPALDVIKWFANWLCPIHATGSYLNTLGGTPEQISSGVVNSYISDKDAELYAIAYRLLGVKWNPSPSAVNECIPRNWKDRIEDSN
jgi:hypothetical protein